MSERRFSLWLLGNGSQIIDRYGMDILIFVVNNGGIYHGDSDDAES